MHQYNQFASGLKGGMLAQGRRCTREYGRTLLNQSLSGRTHEHPFQSVTGALHHGHPGKRGGGQPGCMGRLEAAFWQGRWMRPIVQKGSGKPSSGKEVQTWRMYEPMPHGSSCGKGASNCKGGIRGEAAAGCNS
eukprot:1137654-Pelagomonas_calceolata.AAC.3